MGQCISFLNVIFSPLQEQSLLNNGKQLALSVHRSTETDGHDVDRILWAVKFGIGLEAADINGEFAKFLRKIWSFPN